MAEDGTLPPRLEYVLRELEFRMAFEFNCPEGHLLEGDEADVGLIFICPECNTEFVIPDPGNRAGGTLPPESNEAESGETEPDAVDEQFLEPRRRGSRFKFLDDEAESESTGSSSGPEFPDVRGLGTGFSLAGDSEERLVTIPCPRGHLLETEYDSMGESVLCPECGSEFVLVYSNSIEYQNKIAFKQAVHDHKLGQKWLTWAVVVAVGVVVLLISLIVMAKS